MVRVGLDDYKLRKSPHLLIRLYAVPSRTGESRLVAGGVRLIVKAGSVTLFRTKLLGYSALLISAWDRRAAGALRVSTDKIIYVQ